jgi:hypothetical protein
MRAKRLNILLLIFGTVLIFSCKKTEEYQTEQISEYVPLAKDKYIIYRLDSTVFTNFNRTTEIHSYQEKNVVDAQITDALGRPSYRVFRYLRDTLGSQPWVPAGSFMATPLQNSFELIENNLRFVKLALPLKTENTWKGNRFLPSRPYSGSYVFNNDVDIDTWDYTISGMDETVTLNGKTINDVLTVDGINDVLNVPVTDLAGIGSISYYQEKYAKGIGLIYQSNIMWEYQPNTSGQGGGYYNGFGVMRSMLDHN